MSQNEHKKSVLQLKALFKKTQFPLTAQQTIFQFAISVCGTIQHSNHMPPLTGISMKYNIHLHDSDLPYNWSLQSKKKFWASFQAGANTSMYQNRKFQQSKIT
jgi:hypothetical protein